VLLADELGALGVDAIGRDERFRAFERLQVPSVASLTHGTVIRIGQLVGASTVVVGTVGIEKGGLVVRARSMRLDSGRFQGEVEERASLDDLFALYRRVARRLAPASTRPPATAARSGPPLAAFENYIKGRLAETPRAQETFLRKAIQLFPAYDSARLALWRTHTDAGEPEKALRAALSVAPASASHREAQFVAGYSEVQLKRYDEAFRRLRSSTISESSSYAAAARPKPARPPIGSTRPPPRTRRMPTTSSISGMRTGAIRMVPRPSTGFERRSVAIRPTPTHTSFSPRL
jgi:hypothetical protein